MPSVWPGKTPASFFDLSPDRRWAVIGQESGGRLRLSIAELRTGLWQETPAALDNAWPLGWSADGAWLAATSGTDSLLYQPASRRLEHLPGWVVWSSWPPGAGRDFALVSAAFQVSVGSVDGALRSIGSGLSPAWAPNGRLALVSVESRTSSALQLLDLETGRSRPIVHAADLAAVTPGADYVNFQAAAWSPDGRWLAVAGQVGFGISHNSGLWVVEAATGQPRLLALQDWLWGPQWSADGGYLAFWTAPGQDGEVSIVAVDRLDSQPMLRVAGVRFAWAPKAPWLAVEQPDGGLIVLRADGRAMRRWASGCTWPVWR